MSNFVFHFDKRIISRNPEVFSYVQNGYVKHFISYLLHSDYRQAVALRPWIEEQVLHPDPLVKGLADNMVAGNSMDETALIVLNNVIHLLTYETDQKHWGIPEYWQTTTETLRDRDADCEDGAILAYVLCRLKGIPADRLMIFAGSMVNGGHCWLGYRPEEYPLNWVFLDWCYFPTEASIGQRPFFYIDGKNIHEINPLKGEVVSYYKNIWFGFNEQVSLLSLSYNATQ